MQPTASLWKEWDDWKLARPNPTKFKFLLPAYLLMIGILFGHRYGPDHIPWPKSTHRKYEDAQDGDLKIQNVRSLSNLLWLILGSLTSMIGEIPQRKSLSDYLERWSDKLSRSYLAAHFLCLLEQPLLVFYLGELGVVVAVEETAENDVCQVNIWRI